MLGGTINSFHSIDGWDYCFCDLNSDFIFKVRSTEEKEVHAFSLMLFGPFSSLILYFASIFELVLKLASLN